MNLGKTLKYAVAGLITAGILTVLFLCGQKASATAKERTCSGVEVEFFGNDGAHFITGNDVKSYILKGYKNVSGMRIEEIDLKEIENVLDKKSAILKSEAYTTKDGVLHIMISQREPVVRLVCGSNGWYADDTGYIFPLQKNYTSRVPIVDGEIPLRIKADFMGIPSTAAERQWLDGILGLVEFLGKNRKWDDSIAQIHVQDKGRLTLVPRKGMERFDLGRPENFEKKFARIEKYYKFIAPAKEGMAYRYVNVSIDGQIYCR